MEETVTRSVEETEQFAERFASRLRPGDLIAFRGGMGAGKTAFVRGLARGLGVKGEVSSPTFALVHEYNGSIPLFHFDMYRIESFEDLYSTGFFDYPDRGAIIVVEWSENIEAVLECSAIVIDISILDESTRKITITGGDRF